MRPIQTSGVMESGDPRFTVMNGHQNHPLAAPADRCGLSSDLDGPVERQLGDADR